MNKTLLTCLFVCTWLVSSAQIERGYWLVGGSGTYSSSKVESSFAGTTGSSKTTSLTVTPRGGYFIIDNLAGGITLNYTSSKSTVDSGVGQIENISKTSPKDLLFHHLPDTFQKNTICPSGIWPRNKFFLYYPICNSRTEIRGFAMVGGVRLCILS